MLYAWIWWEVCNLNDFVFGVLIDVFSKKNDDAFYQVWIIWLIWVLILDVSLNIRKDMKGWTSG